MFLTPKYKKKFFWIFEVLFLLLIFTITLLAQESKTKVDSQNPSPMVENTRTHERIENKNYSGIYFEISHLLNRSVKVFIPQKDKAKEKFDLLIHFHGSSYVVDYASEKYNGNIISATVNLGAGSRVYYNQFSNPEMLGRLIDSIKIKAENKLHHQVIMNRLILSGFSAGYGAVKKLLSQNNNYNKIDAVLLLDGMHASYIPEGKVIYEGGKIDTSAFAPFLKFAREASAKKSNKKFLFTHSEIFPGTFVSTTEAADYLISKLKVKNKPVLKWGVLGMQQLSEAHQNHMLILGFAGNTAPDHIDHLHALFHFLNLLMKL